MITKVVFNKISTFRKSVFCIALLLVLALNTSTTKAQVQENELMPKDTTSVADTTKSEAFNEPIEYSSVDSAVFDMNTRKAYLYGNAKMNTEKIELQAKFIAVDFDRELVYATGERDKDGNMKEKPVFKDGDETFNAEEMQYNYRTRKGVVKGVKTQQADGYLLAERTKMHDNKEIHILNGKYTTCDADKPHYYVSLTKAKIVNNDKIIAGPLYFVIEGIPTPIALPFGYFPSRAKRASGIMIPGYGEQGLRGFYFRDLGFYFAMSDYWDLALAADIYTYGSWSIKVNSRYKVRYLFNGSFSANFNQNVIGEKELPGYNSTKDFRVVWNHMQDPKASPNSSFTASVNFSTSSYNKYNENNVGDFLTNTKSSTINYTKRWPSSPFTISANIKGSQNTSTSQVDLSLPLLTFSMARQTPLTRFVSVPKGTWWEKIGISYNANFANSISTLDTLLFTSEAKKKFRYGLQHNIPISTSFNLFKYVTVQPYFNYNGRFYGNSIRKAFVDEMFFNPEDSTYEYGRVVTDTISGLRHVYDFSFGVPFSTKLYGMFTFKKDSKVQAIRHVVTPSVSFSYTPDFSDPRYNYYDKYYLSNTDTVGSIYSYFDGALYGSAPRGRSGSIGFSLGNNLEMKVKSNKDTTGLRKIIILERFGLTTSYNLAADSMNLAPISMNGGTTLFEMITLNMSATFAPYATDSLGRSYNAYELNTNGRLARFANANWSVGGGIGSDFFNKLGQSKDDKGSKSSDGSSGGMYDEYGYIKYKIPWSVRGDYMLNINKTSWDVTKKEFKTTITQSMRFSGNVSITPKWKISATSGYDFMAKKFTTTSINLSRDLHCWELQFQVVPFGLRKSYFFRINIRSSIFEGLEFKREDNWFDNIK